MLLRMPSWMIFCLMFVGNPIISPPKDQSLAFDIFQVRTKIKFFRDIFRNDYASGSWLETSERICITPEGVKFKDSIEVVAKTQVA